MGDITIAVNSLPFTPQQVVDSIAYRLLAASFLAQPTCQVAPARWLCRDLRAERGSPDALTPPTLSFHFEVRMAETSRPALSVGTGDIRRWAKLVETQPVVIVLMAGPLRGGEPRLWMLAVHDWLIKNASDRSAPSPWTESAEVRLDGFMRIADDGANFHELLIRESERALSMDGAKWRTLRDYGLIPVDEATFLEFLRMARFLEIPTRVHRKLAQSSRGQLARGLKEFLDSGGTSSDPMVREWLSCLGDIPGPGSLSEFDRREFRRFTRLVDSGGVGMRMPTYRGLEVGAWRTYVAMYPESVTGLAEIIRTSRHGNDVAFAAAMLPMLALSSDSTVASRAHDALRSLELRAQDFKSYRIRRELLRAPAEAGHGSQMGKLIDLMASEGGQGAEAKMLASYGWIPEIVARNINRKLKNPTRRDVNLQRFYEAMGEVVGTS